MKDEIVKNLENPKELESLYRRDKNAFKQEFMDLYPEIKSNLAAEVWYERLNYAESGVDWGNRKGWLFVIIASLLAFAIAKIPEYTGISEDFFYPRNLSFIFMPFLMIYFILKEKPKRNMVLLIFGLLVVSCIYMNILPDKDKSDSIYLACVYMPFVAWSLLGCSFLGNEYKSNRKRLDFLCYNGDLVVMTTLIIIAGVILTLMTVFLFQAVGLRIEEFYMEYIAIAGLVASPIVTTYITQKNPWLVNKVSPVIARVFTPLVLLTLTVYLGFAASHRINPFLDRNMLLVFNLLLIGVMAIIFFSITGTKDSNKSKFELITLFCLALITIVINGIALSAILYRITEWGFTPNRLAVLGTNVIILTHLLLVAYNLFRVLQAKQDVASVENSIARFLPVYSIWSMVIVFLFPVLYQFI